MAGGVHPYALRRRKIVLSRKKPQESGLLPAFLMALLVLSGFAYGLRWVDHRYAAPLNRSTPAQELRAPVSDQLSAGFRFLFGIKTAQAADYESYNGQLIGNAPVLTMAPGEVRAIDLTFKNTGKAVWSNTGRSYVSAYTIKPKYHASLFRSADWNSSSQTARLVTPTVKPGEKGILRLTITAPKTVGTYADTFQMAAEDTSWIWSAWFPVTVKVSANATPAAPSSPVTTGTASAPATDEALPPPTASLVYRSAERIEAPGGLQMTMRVTYRNDGTATWKKIGLHVAAFSAPDGFDQSIDDASWASSGIPVVAEGYFPRGKSVDLYFTFSTPPKKGDYQLTLDFIADGAELSNAPIVLPIKVIADAGWQPPPPESSGSQGSEATLPPPVTSVGEPSIRVGLYTTDTFEEVSFDGPYEARDANGAKLASFAANARTQFSYDHVARVYRVTNGIVNVASALPIRFEPGGPGEIFTLWSHADAARWNATVIYNKFRGSLELRKNDPNDYVWVINELPMEQYLKGMAETSSYGALEYQKVMATAARSYANWHYVHPGKHWNFTVDATYDQVYKGYVAEKLNPTLSAAVDATRGQIVTYQGEAVITPYYSSSDGRTRAWTEVWGGTTKPWLVSVPAPFDAAAHRPLNGHGVGVSAWDAVGRAAAGAKYDTILRYYYMGTELKKLY